MVAESLWWWSKRHTRLCYNTRMSKEMSIIVLGLWVAVVPYLGIPGSWRTTLVVLSGFALAGVGFLLRGAALSRGVSAQNEHNPFVETRAPGEEPRL